MIKSKTAAMAALLALSACGREIPQAEVDATAKMITSTPWCYLENITDDLQRVTRITFEEAASGNSSRVDYLVFSKGNDLPSFYPSELNEKEHTAWNVKGRNSRTNEYALELVDGSIISSRARAEGAQFEKLKNRYPGLKANGASFAPSMAIDVAYEDEMSGRQKKETFFPCAAYASSFLTTDSARPMLEHNLVVGQRIRDTLRNPDHFKTISLQSPIEKIDTAEAAKEGTSWCSWNSIGGASFILRLRTIGKEQYTETVATTAHLGSRRVRRSMVAHSAAIAKTFAIAESHEELVAVRDAAGTVALVRTGTHGPMASYAEMDEGNIYFHCSTQHPALSIDSDLPTLVSELSEAHRELLK